MPRRRLIPVLLAAAAVLAGSPLAAAASTSTSGSATFTLPAVRHVFVIMLENQGFGATFGDPAADPYLAGTLPAQGALLTQYYGTGHYSNDNYISFVSGQAPNPQNQGDCQYFTDFPGATGVTSGGQQTGSGCVYPASIPTIGSELSAKGLSWKAYEEDMGNVATRESAVCGHPAIGAQDTTQGAVAGDGYVTRHDPFVYFHGVIDNAAYCDAHVVPLGTTTGALPASAPAGTTGLATDLRTVASTPALSFITPNVCDDGHDYPCANQPSGSSALADVDAFLQRWVPLITGSPAFRQDGLLEITFDEADGGDSSACCAETPGPTGSSPGVTGPGGGRTGTVLISRFIRGGTVTSRPYNHYSSLATLESLFGLARTGEAATVSTTFGPDVFTQLGGAAVIQASAAAPGPLALPGKAVGVAGPTRALNYAGPWSWVGSGGLVASGLLLRRRRGRRRRGPDTVRP